MDEQCHLSDQHTAKPSGYLAWHAWAQAMTSNGWRQRRCSGCGRFEIWVGTKPMIPPADYQRGCIAIQFGRRGGRTVDA